MMRFLRAGRHLIFASVGALLAWNFMPANFISQVSAELIAFFGFLMAAVLPAMMLTATSIRGMGLPSERIDILHGALREQMLFFSGLFFVAFVAAIIVILTKPFAICPANSKCTQIILFSFKDISVDTAIINAITAGLVGLLVSQFTNLLKGILVLLELNARGAKAEAEQAEKTDIDAMEREINKIQTPRGFGSTVDLPH